MRVMPALGRRLALAVALVALPAAAACTGIAGISGYEVDPCFDGCEAGPDGTAPPPEAGADAPDGSPSPTEGGADAGVDAPPCSCPAGTTDMNGSCVVPRPLPNSSCNSPLQVPAGCRITFIVNICDTDPTFDYEPVCQGDAGIQARPSAFFQLGVSPTGKTKGTFRGVYNVARPNALCTSGGQTCAGGGTITSNFTNNGMPDRDRVVVGKLEGAGCQDATLVFEPAP